ncbi:MAG: citrate synthase [Deltaproteobacteria bacterium]|nr:citrate synthase [Candidatus Zymogenaceae bacterium]
MNNDTIDETTATGPDNTPGTPATESRAASTYRPGLEGVIATRSAICCIDGEKGRLSYRGIAIEELAEHSTFEETAYLLLYNHLPSERELKEFSTLIARQRHLPLSVSEAIKKFPVGMHPMLALQAAVALLQGEDFYADDVSSPIHNIRRAISLIAKFPTIVAAFDHCRNGEDPLPPVSKYGHAENFLFMLMGDPPDRAVAQVLDKCLILMAEHTLNASTFSARIVGSTNASIYSAVSAAVGALSGSLHGGANERVIRTLYSIGSADNVPKYVDEMLDSAKKIMGLGHRIYKTTDPRAPVLKSYIPGLLDKVGGEEFKELYEIATELEGEVEKKLSHKKIYPNVDFYSAVVLEILRIPIDLFTPVFAVARSVGWAAHWMEQVDTNKIYRPIQEYIGDLNRPYVPIEKR